MMRMMRVVGSDGGDRVSKKERGTDDTKHRGWDT